MTGIYTEPIQLLEALAECLCNTIEDARVPNTCFCGVIHGDGIVTDYAGCSKKGQSGMAWVRMLSAYPAVGINVTDETVNNLGSSTGMDIEVGMVRPVKVVDSRGKPPTAGEYRESAKLMNDDMSVMLRAIQCCGALEDIDSMLGTYQPLGPMGGVGGGTWGVAVLLD